MNNENTQTIVEKVKELVQKGNVSRIVVRKGEQELVNIPVNAGIAGGLVALASAKWVLLASVLATVGFGCCVEIVQTDGKIVNVVDETAGQRIRSAAEGVVSNVKDSVHFEHVVEQDEPAEENPEADIEVEVTVESEEPAQEAPAEAEPEAAPEEKTEE